MWSVLYSQSEIWRAQSREIRAFGPVFYEGLPVCLDKFVQRSSRCLRITCAQTGISLSRAMRSNSPHPLNGPLVRRSSNASPAFAHCSRATLRLTENDSFDSEP